MMAGISGIFSLFQSFFRPQLGDGALFDSWEDDWSELGRLGDAFPCPPLPLSTGPTNHGSDNVDRHLDSDPTPSVVRLDVG